MDAGQLLKKWQDTVTRQQVDAYAALYAPDAVLIAPLSPEPVRGQEGIRQYEGAVYIGFPGATLTLLKSISDDDTIAVEWEYSGTNTGPLPTPAGVLPATNRRMTLRGASFLRLDTEGLIAEEHRYYDARALFQQLGVE